VPQNGEAGGVASLTPKYYSYDYGNIHFLSLDSYGSLNDSLSPMYQWIEADLKATSKTWKIAYFHHPPYSKGTHNSDTEVELIDMRNSIIPLLEKYDVDLVLSGHSHNNERSYFIHGHYGYAASFEQSMKMSNDTHYFRKNGNGNGTIYAVCGTSGQDPGIFQPDAPMPCMYFNNNTDNCSMVIDVIGDFLSASFLTKNGIIADRFTIAKTGHASASNYPFSIYNVPGENIMVINCLVEEESTMSLKIHNTSGQLVFQTTNFKGMLAPGFHRFELSKQELQLSSGVYIVTAAFSGQQHAEKFLIE
jgi:hypothetical protein